MLSSPPDGRRRASLRRTGFLVCVAFVAYTAAQSGFSQTASYLGFDRNDYPGDQNLPALRQTFSFAGYWLNSPPGGTLHDWAGKRQTLDAAGFGFLVLFNGRLDAELKSVVRARRLGTKDGQSAVVAAHNEGFPARTVIFLDQEEGGRMLPEQKAYIYAWMDAIATSGFSAGIYCSGIAAKDDENIVTADDIRHYAGERSIIYFVSDDQCPPSPGCVFPKSAPSPSQSGTGFADVWQFAQSPRRPEYTAGCWATYNADGKCYPLGISGKLHFDIDTASTADPSRGRIR